MWSRPFPVCAVVSFNPVYFSYICKQRIALKASSDCLLSLRISFTIHLRTTRAGFAPENWVMVPRINELKLYYLTV